MARRWAAGDGLQAPAHAAKHQLKMASTFKRFVTWRSVFLVFVTSLVRVRVRARARARVRVSGRVGLGLE